MRRILLALAIGSLIGVAMLFAIQGSNSSGKVALGASVAYAQDDDPIPLPLPRPKDPACARVCLSSAGGAKYCGYGAGRIGCKSIVNNNCIYTLCPL